MSKETLKTIFVWCAFFGIIALAVFGIRSCSKHQDSNRTQAKLERVLNGEYVYEDINGVYHIDENCRMLRKYHYDPEENEVYENYSSQYFPRSIIKSWDGFACTHQLCTKCFSPELIKQLDSVRTVKIYPDGSAGMFNSDSKQEYKGRDRLDPNYR